MFSLNVENVQKKIKDALILDKINLCFSSGKIYGLMGKNGSGKTMLLRILAGLVHPTSGKILWNGTGKPRIGLIIENMGLYPEFTGFENLKLLAGINKIIADEAIRDAITRVGLDPADKRTLKKYSLGMRQRIIIAQAVMEHPDLLLLDEPTNGLDENGVSLMREMLLEEAKRGAIVVIASHSTEDIEFLCDEKYRMASGCLAGWK
ncbi:MAG: ABC transporter ATP-binding protein [Oscillospiraceae bacterium]|jgi:ABC-2 type transport system ATP-binding protein|nr:ABC transporter ATP-binding protein [Oscillospiraceae bacterium]